MKIECKNKREGGSVIDIGGVEYHFKPQADGAHVADVAYEEHIERFLSIPEAYCIYKASKPTKEAPAPVVEAEAAPQPEENAEAEETVAETGDDLEDPKKAFKAKFGHAPHYKWDVETIKTKLAE